SSLMGGANGTGFIDVRDISIPAMQSGVFLRYKVRVLSTSELIAKGVSPSAINGLPVENQGSLSAPFLPMSLVSDDPATMASNDPTVFTLSTGVDFTGADTNKMAVDVNGGLLIPGDTIEFTLTFTNNGSQSGTVNISDDIPPFLTNVVITTPRPEVVFAPPPAGANGTGRLVVSSLVVASGASTQIRFTAVVDSAAPDGASIQNIANMSIVEDAAQNRPLPTTPLEVFNRPLFDTTTKTVV